MSELPVTLCTVDNLASFRQGWKQESPAIADKPTRR